MREAVTGPNFHKCWQIGEKIMLRHSGAQAETTTFSVIRANTHAKDRSIKDLQIMGEFRSTFNIPEWVCVSPCWMPSYKTIRTYS
jgi:hypothetical protein